MSFQIVISVSKYVVFSIIPEVDFLDYGKSTSKLPTNEFSSTHLEMQS